MTTQQEKSHIYLALIDEEVLEYDTCDDKGPRPFIYPKDRWEYLGEGAIHSIDGVQQAGKERLHFWVRKEPNEC